MCTAEASRPYARNRAYDNRTSSVNQACNRRPACDTDSASAAPSSRTLTDNVTRVKRE